VFVTDQVVFVDTLTVAAVALVGSGILELVAGMVGVDTFVAMEAGDTDSHVEEAAGHMVGIVCLKLQPFDWSMSMSVVVVHMILAGHC
jgi:hypothetical protein